MGIGAAIDRRADKFYSLVPARADEPAHVAGRVACKNIIHETPGPGIHRRAVAVDDYGNCVSTFSFVHAAMVLDFAHALQCRRMAIPAACCKRNSTSHMFALALVLLLSGKMAVAAEPDASTIALPDSNAAA